MKRTIIVGPTRRHPLVGTKLVGDDITLMPKEEIIAPNCFRTHIIFTLKTGYHSRHGQHSLVLPSVTNSTSTKLSDQQTD